MKKSPILLGPVFLVLLMLGEPHDSLALEPLVAATLIVKPAAGTQAATHVQDVLKGQPFDAQAVSGWLRSLAAAIEALPLEVVRVTSGGELVLRVPRAPALDALARHLEGQADIDSVEIRPDPAASPFAVEDRLAVIFQPESRGARLLRESDARQAEIEQLASRLLAETPYAGAAAAGPQQELVITVDWQRTTEQLAARLRQHEAIAYIQVERMLKPWSE